MPQGLLINGQWQPGAGGLLASLDPATEDTIWTGTVASRSQVESAIEAAGDAFEAWADRPHQDRVDLLKAYQAQLEAKKPELAAMISQETGKPKWEALGEVSAMIGKVDISIKAYDERTGGHQSEAPFGQMVLRHRAHGVMAVFGPYNFPGHLPNGHIVPALLAGNTVVFKPSEHTPGTGELMMTCLEAAGLPTGVVNLVQGGRDVGEALSKGNINGLLFTGSAATGQVFRSQFAERPEVILALELGGNNPLIAWDGDPAAVASLVLASSFITSGQRCSCARRLILPQTPWADEVLKALAAVLDQVVIGKWDDVPEPFMGPLVSKEIAKAAMASFEALVEAGGQVLRAPERDGAFVSPGVIETTGVKVPDEEIFAPFLQVVRVETFKDAIREANATRYGLSAGLISQDHAHWQQFIRRIRAGVVNWNRATTGASSAMPFGGVGISGNHRPSAYYAADYCAFPMASQEATEIKDVRPELKGLRAE